MAHGVAAAASCGSLLKLQNLGPYPRPLHQAAFKNSSHVHIREVFVHKHWGKHLFLTVATHENRLCRFYKPTPRPDPKDSDLVCLSWVMFRTPQVTPPCTLGWKKTHCDSRTAVIKLWPLTNSISITRNLLEIQILRPCPRPTEKATLKGASVSFAGSCAC